MSDSWIPNDPSSAIYRLWSRANAGEVFPDPITPLNASIGFLHNIEPGWRLALVETGMFDEGSWDDTIPHNPIAVFHGYIYLNMSLSRLFGVRLGVGAQAIDDAYFGDMPGIPSYESEARPTDEDAAATERGQAWMSGAAATQDLARYDADRVTVLGIVANRPDLTASTERELLEQLTVHEELAVHLWQAHLAASTIVGIGIGACGQIAAAIGRPELALALSSGFGDIDSAQATHEMWPLSRLVAKSAHLREVIAGNVGRRWDAIVGDDHPDAVEFVAAVGQFLDRWGFRGPNEWELRSDTWGTKPEILMTAIETMSRADDAESPAVRSDRQIAEHVEAVAAVREALAADEATSAMFEGQLNIAEMFSRARERARMTVALLLHEQRLAANELGRRLVANGVIDHANLIYMLGIDELTQVIDGQHDVLAELPAREARYLELFDYVPPFVVAGDVPPLEDWDRHSQAKAGEPLAIGESLTGLGGAPGSISGSVRIVRSPADPTALEPGEILVCPITDPAWTPLFLAAGGVVCEVGAPVSHAAIVSRELGIPCAVSVGGALSRLADGMVIEIDGGSGTVTRTA
ncbi:MAG: PEP-utilizing enzyme [Acidimicrobiales bacterium]